MTGDSSPEKQPTPHQPNARSFATGSGRREVARLLTTPSNPWTSRVIVNRVWLWMFGRGIVATPDDFGHLGEPPTNPELLDLLAYRFMREEWSIKRLVREIALSQTFQRSSRPTDNSRAQDPDNLWLTHYPARRMEGEVIRDALLQVAGRLDRTMYGPSIHPYRETEDTEKRLYLGPLDGDGRRSIYLKVQLMESPKFLSAFNIPGGKVPQGKRDTTNVPAQSLAMLNDPLVNAMAARWSQTVLLDHRDQPEDRFRAMFFEAIGRPSTSREVQQWLQTIERFRSLHSVNSDQLMTSQAIWHDVAHLIFNLKEFIYIP